MAHTKRSMNGAAKIILHGEGVGWDAGPVARPIFSQERVGGPPGRQSARASPVARGAGPMKEGLPSPPPGPPPPQGHLGGRALSDTASALRPAKSSSPQTSVWGEACWGLGGGVFEPHRPRRGSCPFSQPGLPASQPPPPSRPREGHRWGLETKVRLSVGGGSKETGKLARLHPQPPSR